MEYHRYLQVLPGGRSGPRPTPDGHEAPRSDMLNGYADPYAVADRAGGTDAAGRRLGQPGADSDGPGRARLWLVPPLPDTDDQDAQADAPSAEGRHAAPAISAYPADQNAGRATDAGCATATGARRTVSAGTITGAGRHRRALPPRAADLSILPERGVRVLQAAQLLSSAGDQIARVAIAVLVYGQTRSALLTAVAYALTYLPPLIGGRVVRRLTGRLGRRTLMVGIDLARAALIAAMALPGARITSLFALLVVAMLLSAPYSAARAALASDRVHSRPVRPGRPDATGGRASGKTGALPARSFAGYQTGQALGFVAGAYLVTALQPRRTLLIDAGTFLVSACLMATLAARRPPALAQPAPAGRTASTGAHLVAHSSALRTLVLLGWLAGFYVVPEGLAAPYARTLGGGTVAVGLLMAAMPAGAVLGTLALTRLARPSSQMDLLIGLAMLSCVPLIFSALQPPLWAVLALWTLAGVGTCYQLAALTAFVRTLAEPADQAEPAEPAQPVDQAEPAEVDPVTHDPARADGALAWPGRASGAEADPRASALGFASAGLLAAQCLGFLVAGAAAQLIGPQAAVALAGLSGLAAATALARGWRRELATGRDGGSCALADRQRQALTGRRGSGALARSGAGRGAGTAES